MDFLPNVIIGYDNGKKRCITHLEPGIFLLLWSGAQGPVEFGGGGGGGGEIIN